MALSWSLYPIITFRSCQRKHFFSQVLAKNYEKSTLLEKQAYWLKKSITLDMWAGELIDQIITEKIIPIFEGKDEPDFNGIENYAIDLLRRQWEFSKMGKYKVTSDHNTPEEYCVLDMHENSTPFRKEELETVAHKVRKSIQNLQTIKLPDGTLLIDLLKNADWLSPNRNDRHVKVGDANVGPQIDLLFWKDKTQYVIDWKVSDGKNSDYSLQLNIIGMVIYRRRIEVFEQETEQGKDSWMYDFNKTKIVLYEVNLFKGYIKEHPFTPASYGEAVDYVHRTSKDIELFKKGRTWKEIPLHEYAHSESDYQCNTCPYRHLCDYLILKSHENEPFNSKNYREFIQNQQLI